MPRPKASDAAGSLVGDLTAFTNEEIANGLENVDVSFTCKVCHVTENTLHDLLNHLSNGKCSQQVSGEEDGKQPVPRPRRGRPPKPKPSPSPASKSVSKTGSASQVPNIKKGATTLADASPVDSPRRVTRITSGSIKRKTAAEILGLAIKEEPVSEGEGDVAPPTPSTTPKRRGRGRPKKNKEEEEQKVIIPGVVGHEERLVEESGEPAVTVVSAIIKRARGRPRKVPEQPKDAAASCEESMDEAMNKSLINMIKEEIQETDGPFTKRVDLSQDSLDEPSAWRKLPADAAERPTKKPKLDLFKDSPLGSPLKGQIFNLTPGSPQKSTDTMSPQKSPGSTMHLLNVGQPTLTPTRRPPKIVFKQQMQNEATGKRSLINLTLFRESADETQSDIPATSVEDSQPAEGEAEAWQALEDITREAGDHVNEGGEGQERDDAAPIMFLDEATGDVSEHNTLDGTHELVEGDAGLGGGESDNNPHDDTEPEEEEDLEQVAAVAMEAFDVSNTQHPTKLEAPTGPYSLGHAKWKRERKFRCPHCKSRGFGTAEEAALHVQCHVSPGPEQKQVYKCPDCDLQAPQWTRMLYHLVTHDQYREMLQGSDLLKNMLGEFKCPLCSKVFNKKVNFTCHYRKIHFKKKRVCDICGDSIYGSDIKTFHRHVEKCKNIVKYCTQCDYKTTVSNNLVQHMKLHSGGGYMCNVCQRFCTSKARLRVHQRTHDPNRPLVVCDQCGKNFKTSDAVKKHILRFHTEHQHMYECTVCGFTTKISLDLKKHVKCVHNKKYRCPDCQFQSNSESSFETHLSYHLPDRIYPCPYTGCFYRACTTKQMADHLSQVHNVKSKHQCPLCYKYYKKRTHLLRHLVSHTGEKAYHCKECSMEFVSHSSYYRHRNKTGHDAKREGVVSVPQNITIQYVEEGSQEAMEVTAAADDESDDQPTQDKEWTMTEVTHIPEVINRIMAQDEQEGAMATNFIRQVMEDGEVQQQQQQVFEETVCMVPMAGMNSDECITVQPNIHVTVEEMEGDHKPVLVPTTYSLGEGGTETIHTLQIPDPSGNMLEDSQQVIYVVKSEDGSMVASTDDMSVPLEQPVVDTSSSGGGHQFVQDQHEMTLEELMTSQVVVQEDGSMAFVEVSGGDTVEVAPDDTEAEGEYSAVITEVQVPEAALSMLQLQSGKQ